MSEVKEDPSDFFLHLSSLGSMYTLICGFTFTTITLLVTLLPDLKEMRVQAALLLLTIEFDLFVYLIAWNNSEGIQYCSYVPPMTRRMNICNALTSFGLDLWGFSIPAMFLLWSLDALALVATVIWIALIPITYFTVSKLFTDYRKRMATQE
jgi:hypothetical protein